MSQRLLIKADWLPTSDNINSLPGPLKKYIHELESFSGSDMIQYNFELLQNFEGTKALMLMYKSELEQLKKQLI